MLFNDLPLDIIQFIFLFRIDKGNARMPESVQPFALRQICLVMPVIEKIVMQQRASDQIMFVTPKSQLFIQKQTVARHIHYMIVHRHRTVLDMLLGLLKVLRLQNIGPVLFQ